MNTVQTPTASASRFMQRDGRLSYVEALRWHVSDDLLSAFRTIEMLEERLARADREIAVLKRDLRITQRALTQVFEATNGPQAA